MSESKHYIFQQASLSQKISFNIPILRNLSGTDTELSDSIAIITYLGEKGLIDKADTVFILGLLDVLRLSHFATSERINEITKLGFMLPKSDAVVTDWDVKE